MTELVINMIFSVLLMPFNLYCSLWIFREAMNISGVTFKEMLKDMPGGYGGNTRHKMRRRQRGIYAYLAKKSGEPEKILRLLRAYMYSTLPGLAALALAEYAMISGNPHRLKFAFAGNIILLIINLILLAAGKAYKEKHPLNETAAEKLRLQREKERTEDTRSVKNYIAVYSVTGAFFLGFIVLFNLAIGGVIKLPAAYTNRGGSPGEYIENSEEFSEKPVEKPDAEKGRALLEKHGFEMPGNPAIYSYLDGENLMYIAAGTKGDKDFQLYEYSTPSAEPVYNCIADDIGKELTLEERFALEKGLNGGRKFVYTQNGVTYTVLYKENIIIFARCPEGDGEIEEMLRELKIFEEG